jgi:uncharacterized protein
MIFAKQPFQATLCAAALLILSACETAPPREDAQAAPREQAAELLQRGDLEGAAALYWQQAEQASSPEREDLQLRAVETVLTPRTARLARQYLDVVLRQDLRGPLLVRARIAQAQLALIEEQPAEALAALPPGISLSTPQFETQVDDLRAQALLGTGQILQSVRLRSQLARRLEDPRALKLNQRKLWEALGRASEQQVARWAQAETDPGLRGWLALSYIAKTSPSDARRFDQELNAWQQRYPGHPAQEHILVQLRKDWRALQLNPKQIAVLLPLSGPLASVAEAVMDGFMAAYYADEGAPDQPEVRVYDVGEDTAVFAQYTRAVQDGADIVVGPLDKEAVAALGSHAGLPVPILTLNYSERVTDPPQGLYEFGLLPEDEARQVAERASLAGHDTALALAPEGEWGERLLSAFSHRFRELGGQVLDVQRYEEAGTDFSTPIKDLLGIDVSVARYEELRALLKRDLEFEPRSRPDADMLFMAALPRQARLLRPQLKFHYAADLPVYATSHIYAGIEATDFDRDIDGVIYCDMPWMLEGANPKPELKARMARLFPLASQQLARLIALGFDAYRVLPYLKRLDERAYERYAGLTGDLHMDDRGRIHRELKWARFVNGEPQLMESIEARPSTGAVAIAP